MTSIDLQVEEHELLFDNSEKTKFFLKKLSKLINCFSETDFSKSIITAIKNYIKARGITENLALEILITSSSIYNAIMIAQDCKEDNVIGNAKMCVLSKGSFSVILNFIEFETNCVCCNKKIKVYILFAE